MPEFTKEHEKTIQETHDTVLEIKTVLLGKNGDEGMCGQLKDLIASHYTLKRNFWILVGILIGSGVISSTVIAALNAG
ncbi:MAG: hypothetical protein A2158_01685 [Chloroflexi bacterium RBG_13_46_14]|nr:MAG: hypothetical protein A2158_01685 [Chloroflexi bacterium RBG_13_46_14]